MNENHSRYTDLLEKMRRLSTEDLERLIQSDLETDEDNPDFTRAAVTALYERENAELTEAEKLQSQAQAQQAFEKFKAEYMDKEPLYPELLNDLTAPSKNKYAKPIMMDFILKNVLQ